MTDREYRVAIAINIASAAFQFFVLILFTASLTWPWSYIGIGWAVVAGAYSTDRTMTLIAQYLHPKRDHHARRDDD